MGLFGDFFNFGNMEIHVPKFTLLLLITATGTQMWIPFKVWYPLPPQITSSQILVNYITPLAVEKMTMNQERSFLFIEELKEGLRIPKGLCDLVFKNN